MLPSHGVLAATAAVSNTDAHVSMFGLLGRLLVSLFVVLMVLWVLAQIVRKRGLPGSRSHGARAARRQIDVLARQSIGKGQTLVTVRTDDRVLLLGVTPQNITTLGELDPAAYGIAPGTGEVLELEPVSSESVPSSSSSTSSPTSTTSALAAEPMSSTSSNTSAGTSGTSATAVFSWNQRLDRLRERTVRR